MQRVCHRDKIKGEKMKTRSIVTDVKCEYLGYDLRTGEHLYGYTYYFADGGFEVDIQREEDTEVPF